MRKKIDNNNLMPWFMDDHRELPASYLKSCKKFFKKISSKHQATSSKPQACHNTMIKENYDKNNNRSGPGNRRPSKKFTG